MEATTAERGRLSVEAILPGFVPVSILWEGEAPPYRSDQAARWALRKFQQQLADANAMALWQGRLYIHQERFIEVVRADALGAARQRAARLRDALADHAT